ncbi:hypothetical protein VP01_3178g1, partial [Puccinia sorghi]
EELSIHVEYFTFECIFLKKNMTLDSFKTFLVFQHFLPKGNGQTQLSIHKSYGRYQKEIHKITTPAIKRKRESMILSQMKSLNSKSAPESLRIQEIFKNHSSGLFNLFLKLNSFDGCQDTPVEVLHFFLLGILKYLFKYFMSQIPKNNLVEIFIGKDFQTVIQAAPLIFFPIMTQSQKDMWISMCQLVSLILQTRVPDMDEYIASIKTATQSLLYHLVKMNARWANKSKIHMLLHLPESIRRFGPQSLFATEKFESYNGILRNPSIHSNRLSPGRDIGITFSNYHIIRLLLSGTYFLDPTTSDYVQVSPLVQDIFSNNERIQKSLGFPARSLTEPPLTPELHNHKVEERNRKPVPDHLKQTYPKNIIRQISCVTIFTKGKISQGTFVLEKYQPNQSVSIGCVESMSEIISLNP